MNLPLLKNAENLSGKRVLVRVDFNIPAEGDVLKDDYRIQAALPTIRLLLEKEVASVVLLAHHSDKEQSLEPMARFLGKEIANTFVKDPFAAGVFAGGGVFVCENLRLKNSPLL